MTEQRDQTGLTGGALPHTALPVGTPGAAPGGGAGVEESLEPKFLELADQWRTDSLVMSSVTDMARLPSYQQIIALGPPVIPLLLRELERRPGHWFVALHALTGATPIPEESRGRVKEMAQAWLRWGREQGYRWQMANHARTRRIVESLFPQLQVLGYRLTSPADDDQNCIAWSAGDAFRWWWPIDPKGLGYHWPPNVPKELTVAAFVQAYETLGYALSGNDRLEPGLEKVALFALDGVPKHAARQLSNGLWTSKLGVFVDVEHALDGLAGPHYGAVVQVLQRPGGPAGPLADLAE